MNYLLGVVIYNIVYFAVNVKMILVYSSFNFRMKSFILKIVCFEHVLLYTKILTILTLA